MALQDPQAEPSMEEILASIRRIISEEEQAPNAEPVLDLTQTDEPTTSHSDDDIVFEAVEQAVIEEKPVPSAAPVYEPPPTPAPTRTHAVEPAGESYLAAPTTNASAAALARLAGTLKISEQPGQTV